MDLKRTRDSETHLEVEPDRTRRAPFLSTPRAPLYTKQGLAELNFEIECGNLVNLYDVAAHACGINLDKATAVVVTSRMVSQLVGAWASYMGRYLLPGKGPAAVAHRGEAHNVLLDIQVCMGPSYIDIQHQQDVALIAADMAARFPPVARTFTRVFVGDHPSDPKHTLAKQTVMASVLGRGNARGVTTAIWVTGPLSKFIPPPQPAWVNGEFIPPPALQQMDVEVKVLHSYARDPWSFRATFANDQEAYRFKDLIQGCCLYGEQQKDGLFRGHIRADAEYLDIKQGFHSDAEFLDNVSEPDLWSWAQEFVEEEKKFRSSSGIEAPSLGSFFLRAIGGPPMGRNGPLARPVTMGPAAALLLFNHMLRDYMSTFSWPTAEAAASSAGRPASSARRPNVAPSTYLIPYLQDP